MSGLHCFIFAILNSLFSFSSFNSYGYRTENCSSQTGRVGGAQAITLGRRCLTTGSQDQIVAKQNSLLPPGQNVQQQLLDGQLRSRQQHQKLDITNTFDNLAKDDNKNVADAFATQQQHLEALLMNQMFNHQRKSGHESLSQQSTMAYMQQYMKVRKSRNLN